MCVDWKNVCCNLIMNFLPASPDWVPFETAMVDCTGWLLHYTMSLTSIIGLQPTGGNASTQMVFECYHSQLTFGSHFDKHKVFAWHDHSGVCCGIMATHVDDFVYSGSADFINSSTHN